MTADLGLAVAGVGIAATFPLTSALHVATSRHGADAAMGQVLADRISRSDVWPDRRRRARPGIELAGRTDRPRRVHPARRGRVALASLAERTSGRTHHFTHIWPIRIDDHGVVWTFPTRAEVNTSMTSFAVGTTGASSTIRRSICPHRDRASGGFVSCVDFACATSSSTLGSAVMVDVVVPPVAQRLAGEQEVEIGVGPRIVGDPAWSDSDIRPDGSVR